MKKIIPLLFLMTVLFTSCKKEADINGTYTLEDSNQTYTVSICDNFCMIDIMGIKDNRVVSALFDGKVSKKDNTVLISIDNHPEISGNKFKFIYNERDKTLTNTSDNTVFKKITVDSIVPVGTYTATHENKTFSIIFEGNNCILSVKSENNAGQVSEIKYDGTVSVNENIILIEFSDSDIKLEEDVFSFIYDHHSDSFMNTSDGHIFTNTQKEN